MKEKEPPASPKVDEEVQALKEKGNECYKNENYEEAVLHYTHAIKRDPTNYSLYSNRSSAFLHLQQHYLALEDANETIRLQPMWAKGYFRKGEVEFRTFHFLEALVSYGIALSLDPKNALIEASIERTNLGLRTDKRADEQIPWLGAGIGIIIGVSLVIGDHVLAAKPTLAHPLAMVLVTILISLVGYAGCRGYRSYIKSVRSGLLDPPLDLLEERKQKETVQTEMRNRYSKAQARQRMKKGKS